MPSPSLADFFDDPRFDAAQEEFEDHFVSSPDVRRILVVTQAEYDALTPPRPVDVQYNIVG